MYRYSQPSHVQYQQNNSNLQRGNFVTFMSVVMCISRCCIRYDIFVNCDWVCHPVASSTAHIYAQTTRNNTNNNRTTQITNNLEECGPCPVFASFTLAFALQLRKTHENLSQGKKNRSQSTVYILPKHTHTHGRTHTCARPHITKPTHTRRHITKPTHTHTPTH